MLNKLEKLIPLAPVLSLIVVGLIVTATNYKIGTYLSGWDTLHPEFNLGLYLERVFFGAWQEHQGLGAPASQAHAAELSRIPLLFLLDLVLPQSVVRYAFFSLMYVLGGLGVYAFIRKCWFERRDGPVYDWAASLGGLLFMLNLGTLQHFYVPLEMFAVHFATVGIVLYSLYQAVKYPSPKNYAIFFGLQFLSSAAAHTATLFYMYTATLFVYALILSTTTWKKRAVALRQIVILGLLTLAANFFWIGPNLYYILRHSDYVKEAKITREFSSEAFWQNQAFGEIQDVLIFKNFLFNWKDYDFETQSFSPLFNEWQGHLESIGYPYLNFVAVLCLMGLALSFFNKDLKHAAALFSLFIVPVFFINNLNFPSNSLYILLQSLSDTLSEALRFPFTKFSILLMVTMSVYFATFAQFVFVHFQRLSSTKDKKYFLIGGISVLFLLVLIPTVPAILGNLFSPRMKVQYPDEYSQLFNWFEQQPRQARIAKFPLVNQFGWTYHSWPQAATNQGYQGAGFIWFGLPQPILDREFDRWSASNEYFYYELSYAVDQNNPEAFRQVLDKYDVRWLLFDESAINTNSQFKKDYATDFKNLVSATPGIALANQINFLKIYSVESNLSTSWVGSEPTTAVADQLDRVKEDSIYQSEGNYISTKDATVSYPFAQLKRETSERYIFEETFLTASTKATINGTLELPEWTEDNRSISAEVYAQLTADNTLEISVESLLPELRLNNETVSLSDFASQKTLKYYLELPNPDDSYILKLSNSYIIFKPTTAPLYFGSFSFPIDSVPIELYSSVPQATQSLIAGYQYSARNCFDQQTHNDIVSNTTGDVLFLFAYRNTACATKPQFHSLPGKGLLLLDYSYRSTTPNTYTRVCLFRQGSEGCINQGEYYTDIASEEVKSLQVFEPIEESTQINVSFDLSSEQDGKNIEYSNATLKFYPHILTIEIAGNSLMTLAPKATSLPVREGTTISLAQPFGRDSELLQKKDLTFLATAQNCAAEGDVNFIPSKNGHELSASSKGIACEHFQFDSIVPEQEYIVSVTANNVQGKELLVHLLESEQVLVNEVFDKGVKTHNFWVDNQRESDNLQLSLEGHSYGKYESVNVIQNVAVAPFPVSYASLLRIEGSTGETLHQAAEIISSTRRANFWYTVKTKATKPSALYLSQTFDPGWRAFAGGRQLPHSVYNSWANGWVIPEGEHTITIFYMPQLLEFSGLVLLVSISLWGWLHFDLSVKELFSRENPSKFKLIKARIKQLLRG